MTAVCQDDLVRAKVGIMIRSKDRVISAKKKARIRPGDQIRIYALPEKPSYVYVIHSDKKTATLLNDENQRVANGALTLPAPQDFYEIDGQSSKEIITIVCSRQETQELKALFASGQVPHRAWAPVEKDLLGKNPVDLTGKAEKPFSIAGSVRGGAGAADPFIEKLQTISGNDLVVRQYELRVKKLKKQKKTRKFTPTSKTGHMARTEKDGCGVTLRSGIMECWNVGIMG